MIAKLVIASVLVSSSVSGSALENLRGADGSTAQWPVMHQCTLNEVSNFTVTNTGGASTGPLRVAGEITVSRIDLRVTEAPGGSPTITALAINTKGTGANSGRASGAGRNQLPIGIDCVKSVVTGDEAAQKAALAPFAFMSADGKGIGWSCSVSGSEEKPVFRVGVFMPATLVQASASRATWSRAGSKYSGPVSIVRRSAGNSESGHVACASNQRQLDYDLVMNKKP